MSAVESRQEQEDQKAYAFPHAYSLTYRGLFARQSESISEAVSGAPLGDLELDAIFVRHDRRKRRPQSRVALVTLNTPFSLESLGLP